MTIDRKISIQAVTALLAALVALMLLAAMPSPAAALEWSLPAIDLSAAEQESEKPQVAVAANGAATAVWRRYDGSNWIIQARTRPAGSNVFAAVQDLSAAGQDASDPQVAVAADGAVTVVWMRKNDGFRHITQARTRPAGSSTFGAVVDLSVAEPEWQNTYEPRVAVAADGATTVVWVHWRGWDSVIQARTRPAGSDTFGAVANLSSGEWYVYSPQVAVGANGATTVIWADHTSVSVGIIKASIRPAGSGAFGAAVDLSVPLTNPGEPQVVVGGDGATTVVWNSLSDVVQARTRSAGSSTFSAAENLSATGAGSASPQVAAAADGATTVVWRRWNGSNDIVEASTRPAGSGTFGGAVDLSAAGATLLQVAVAGDGATTVVWRRWNGSNFSVQARTRPAGSSTFSAAEDLSAAGQSAYSPQVAVASDGTTTVVWGRSNGSNKIVQARTSSVDRLPDPKPWPPVSEPASPEARQLAPLLRQDSDENWDVLDVDKYFGDMKLLSAPSNASEIEWKAVRSQDGATPKTYVNFLSAQNGYDWFDYWWYQSYNDGPSEPPWGGFGENPPNPWECPTKDRVSKFIVGCLDHWSDWEGVALGRSRTQFTTDEPGRFTYAVLRAHEDPSAYKYVEGVLRCGLDKEFCGTGSDGGATRVNIYQSRGTHASYPEPCEEKECRQRRKDWGGGGSGVYGYLPEGRFDGKGQEGKGQVLFQNAETSVMTMPSPGESWMNIACGWGPPSTQTNGCSKLDGSVTRPQSLDEPGKADWDLAFGRTKTSALQRSPAEKGIASASAKTRSECDFWFGPSIQASVCDEAALLKALKDGSLGNASRVTVQSPGVEAGGAGITQSAGDPLAPGQKVKVTGRAAASSKLRVIAEGGGFITDALFKSLGLADGKGSVTASVSKSGAVVAKTEKGRVLKPAVISKTDVRILAAPKLRNAKRSARTVTVKFRKPTSGQVVLSVLDKKGVLLVSKTVQLKRGTAKIVLPAAAAKRAVKARVAQLNDSGTPGRQAVIKISR